MLSLLHQGKGPVIVAVCGYKRCGKDTLCDYLCQNYRFIKLSFAEPLKRMAQAAFGFTPEQTDGNLKDVIDTNFGVTPRKVLQFLGTEVIQHHMSDIIPGIGKCFWAKRMTDRILSLYKETDPDSQLRIVVSDLRFTHEYHALHHMVAHINANNPFSTSSSSLCIVRVDRDALDKNDTHISEQEFHMIPHNICIHNNGTKQDFYNSINKELFGLHYKHPENDQPKEMNNI